MDELNTNEFELIVPSLIEMLDAIHRVDISKMEGYGPFDEKGTGLYSSWADSLRSVGEEGDENSFYGK